MDSNDRELGMGRAITRRDFLNGAAVAIGALGGGDRVLALDGEYYPPALTGMRGSHAGSFEVMHALRDAKSIEQFGNPTETGEMYDLVVAGGGISGLAAAYFYRARAGPNARILILDNHDDFGGHAKRNEFRVRGGRLLLANGGTYAIESPTPYSLVAHGLLDELGVHPAVLDKKCTDADAYRGVGNGFFFDKVTFGVDRLVTGVPEGNGAAEWRAFLGKSPLSATAQRDILRLQEDKADYLPRLSEAEKKRVLAKTSYRDFLAKHAQVTSEAIAFYQTRTHDLYGVGIDAVNALDCWAYRYPGFGGMKLARVPGPGLGYTARGEVTKREPYFFHFPDGNASIARLLVRSLIPGAIPGKTAEDIVLAKADYSKLDRSSSPVRIRLNSTAVSVRDSSGGVDVEYVTGGRLYRVRGRAVVMACWNMVIPYVCPQLPAEQKEALRYGAKVPLVYTVVELRNWRVFHELGVRSVDAPGMYHTSMYLDDAVDIGGYRSPRKPDDPILLRMLRTPCKPGLPERDQHRLGRYDLLATSFDTFERKIRDQLARTLGTSGFDAADDVEAITVNRWPHGYAYEYNSLFDPEWPAGERPCDIARRPFGNIAIANSDAAAAAYTDQAIDQAHRAVTELARI